MFNIPRNKSILLKKTKPNEAVEGSAPLHCFTNAISTTFFNTRQIQQNQISLVYHNNYEFYIYY